MTAFVNQAVSLAAEIDELGRQPAPKRKRNAPERAAQIAVVSYLRTALPPGSVIAAIKNEHGAKSKDKRSAQRFGQKRKAEGVTPGFPDLICLLPGGRVFLLEMKSAVGTLSAAQIELHDHLATLGFPVAVARCIWTAEAAIRAAGMIPRRSRLDPA